MGIRVDVKRPARSALATVGAIAAFAAIDLARPEEDRTHLGRLVSRVADDDGGGGFLEVIERKLGSNISILTSSVWTLTIPFALGLLIYLARRRSGFLRDLQEQVPGIRAMRSEEHTSELQSLMRISYAVFCLKKKNKSTHRC